MNECDVFGTWGKLPVSGFVLFLGGPELATSRPIVPSWNMGVLFRFKESQRLHSLLASHGQCICFGPSDLQRLPGSDFFVFALPLALPLSWVSCDYGYSQALGNSGQCFQPLEV